MFLLENPIETAGVELYFNLEIEGNSCLKFAVWIEFCRLGSYPRRGQLKHIFKSLAFDHGVS